MTELAEDWTKQGRCPITGWKVARAEVDNREKYRKLKNKKK